MAITKVKNKRMWVNMNDEKQKCTVCGSKEDQIIQMIFNQPQSLANYLCHWSNKHSYVYVETPKVACTTIKRVLQQAEANGLLVYGTPDDVYYRKYSPLLSPCSNISAFADAMISDDYFRFCFVRNPFTRILSCYLDKMVENVFERNPVIPKLGLNPDNPPSFASFRACSFGARRRRARYPLGTADLYSSPLLCSLFFHWSVLIVFANISVWYASAFVFPNSPQIYPVLGTLPMPIKKSGIILDLTK